MKLVIITGLSGSGKSTTLHTLEDLGYYCIDNLPVFMLETFGRELGRELARSGDQTFPYRLTAVGIDARNQSGSLPRAAAAVSEMRNQGIDCQILFLEAEDETLLKRFSETRRKHPLTDPDRPLAEAIQLERTLLEPLLGNADLRIDTTHTNIHELRGIIHRRLMDAPSKRMSILFQSFGHKHGVPGDADFVYDVRCLPNPHWKAELRSLTGRDQAVMDFLGRDGQVRRMQDHIGHFLEAWIPAFEEEGRSYLTIAIGCTGGRHRSVYLAERLARHFQALGYQVLTRHRELP
ncbi:MAG TPA: RNase adapter RapZ [Sedimenticola sp.]|nr:RNase adapter RapZ [Sedimenticola sp.]